MKDGGAVRRGLLWLRGRGGSTVAPSGRALALAKATARHQRPSTFTVASRGMFYTAFFSPRKNDGISPPLFARRGGARGVPRRVAYRCA